MSWACSWGMLSAILGSFFWGLLADKYGRKVTGFLTMVPYLIGWIILLGIKTEMALMASRFLGGLGASGAAINVPMFVGEISDTKTNAGLGSMFILMYNMGVLYVYIFGVALEYDGLNWACLAVSVLFMVVWYYVPESPVFLVRRDRVDEAKASLRFYRCKDNDKEVEEEIGSINLHCGKHQTATQMSDFLQRDTIKALIIGIVFQTGTQFSGINVILMNTVDIFRHSGSTLSAETCTMLVGVVQVIGSIIALVVVNKAGRKFFLIGTYVLTVLALVTIGGCFFANQIDNTITTGLLPVFSLSLHVTAFSVGLGMVPYIIYAEIFPANTSNKCMSVLMFWNNMLGFAIVKAYPQISETLHISGCFWMFAVVCLLIIPFTYFCVPETKDKTCEEIHDSLLLWFPDRSRRKDKNAIADEVQMETGLEMVREPVEQKSSVVKLQNGTINMSFELEN